MTKNIEVELRGPLSKAQYDEVLAFLKVHGTHTETKSRVLLDYSTFLDGEGIAERTRDIRLRITNGQPEIITKLGTWGGTESRREISIKTEKGSFDALVETYGVLGYTKAVLCVRYTEVFMYKDIEFAIVTVPNHSFYFEAEKMVAPEEDIVKVQSEMESVCSELGLDLFDDSTFHAYIETLNKEANEVFDFANYTPHYFSTRFNF